MPDDLDDLFNAAEAQLRPTPQPKTRPNRFEGVDLSTVKTLERIARVTHAHAHDAVIERLFDNSESAHVKEMADYDAELFEGLFLRYGPDWVNKQMTRLFRKFPSYRQK